MSGRSELRRRFARIFEINKINNDAALVALLTSVDTVFDEALSAGAMAPLGTRESTIAAINNYFIGSVVETHTKALEKINKSE